MKVDVKEGELAQCFPPPSCSSAFRKLQRALCQASIECRQMDVMRQFCGTGGAVQAHHAHLHHHHPHHHPHPHPSHHHHQQQQQPRDSNDRQCSSAQCCTCHTVFPSSSSSSRPSSRPSSSSSSSSSSCRDRCSAGESRALQRWGVDALASRSLLLTGPMSHVVRMQRYKWFQLSGHEDAISLAGPGSLWKKTGGANSAECAAYRALMDDGAARPLVPRFFGQVQHNGECFIEIEDLLFGFDDCCVMDIKMGTRTFLESEVGVSVPRPDLYKKMVAMDPEAPSTEEHQLGAVTKMRYMMFREQCSSSSTLGFRIEGLKMENTAPVRQLRHLRTRSDVTYALSVFSRSAEISSQLLQQLNQLRSGFERSSFFSQHEVVGSSILLVHGRGTERTSDGGGGGGGGGRDVRSGAWMIDFAKTMPLPANSHISHRAAWSLGNREDGYLTGLDNLISILEEVNSRFSVPQKPS